MVKDTMVKTLFTKDNQPILIDDGLYDLASSYAWVSWNKNGKYNEPVTMINGKRVAFSKLMFASNKQRMVYHRNGNRFDFRSENILVCSRSELGHIIGSTNRKHSQYKGVIFYPKLNQWYVRIIKDHKIIEGGYFASIDDASIVADYLIIMNHGKNAKRNHPDIPFEQIKERYNNLFVDTKVKRSKSMQGVTTSKSKTSIYVGVSRSRGRWAAKIKYEKKTHYLGSYEKEIDAALSYDKKAIEFYGMSAKVNFPT